MAVQAGPGDARSIEAALERKAGFLWRVIERADNKIFTGVSARTPRQLFVFRRQTLHNLGPGNFSACRRQD